MILSFLRMEEFGIQPEKRIICFGQLFGMCDHISFNLSKLPFTYSTF